jgi:hypothetical protein
VADVGHGAAPGMAGGRQNWSGNGRHLNRAGVGRVYRGSSKRIRRIRWQEHTPREFLVLIVIETLLLVALISWLTTHPETGLHNGGQVTVDSR